jgi:hypothetical protein
VESEVTLILNSLNTKYIGKFSNRKVHVYDNSYVFTKPGFMASVLVLSPCTEEKHHNHHYWQNRPF